MTRQTESFGFWRFISSTALFISISHDDMREQANIISIMQMLKEGVTIYSTLLQTSDDSQTFKNKKREELQFLKLIKGAEFFSNLTISFIPLIVADNRTSMFLKKNDANFNASIYFTLYI